MRKAKIVATMGPSCQDLNILEKMIKSGLNVARINMSHGTQTAHAEMIEKLRQASKNTNQEIAILMDLQGPKIRVEKLYDGNGNLTTLQLITGEEWYIGSTNPRMHPNFIPTSYHDIVKDAKPQHRVLFDDGLLEATVVDVDDDYAKISVTTGGTLKSNKGINLPDSNVSAPSLTLKDESDLNFGLTKDIDFVALSFVRCSDDILRVREIMRKNDPNKILPIIAKIEKPEALTNLEEIIDACDGIMIARGDMAVEVGVHLVPRIQKQIISLCNQKGKPVITATQMLESMTTNISPTRAEATDVANSVWDGTDALMLSGETASGVNPVNVIQTMHKIICEAEKNPTKKKNLLMTAQSFTSNIQMGATLIAENVEASAIVSFSNAGISTQRLSSCRPSVPVIGITHELTTSRRMCLMWGVIPTLMPNLHMTSPEQDQGVLSDLKALGSVKTGQTVVICRAGGKSQIGSPVANSIKLEVVL